jgi:large subunit ribosomal protein L18
MINTKYTVKHRRKREGKTNYKKRLQLLKGRKDRLIVRKTNTQITLQIARYEPEGDKVLLTIQSKELKKKGWTHSCKNTSAAYLAGYLTAKKALSKGIKEAVLDMGLQTPISGNKIYAALKGAIDGGLNINANEEIFPTEARLKGEHIANHNQKSKNIAADFEKIKATLK